MDTVLWLCPSLPTETLKWLSLLPILMQDSFWCWQCSDRYIISLFPHLLTIFPSFFPSLISLMVSVDVKHHVYLGLVCFGTLGSNPGFISRGFMTAHLRGLGTIPEIRLSFKMLSTTGKRYCKTIDNNLRGNWISAWVGWFRFKFFFAKFFFCYRHKLKQALSGECGELTIVCRHQIVHLRW